MTDGTSQGLFIVVAIVIFGIFVVLAYILFEDTLSPALATMFTEATEKYTSSSDVVIDGDYEYTTIKNGTQVKIVKYIGSSKDVVIPNLINGIPVTFIEQGSFSGQGLTSVVLPDTLTHIASGSHDSSKPPMGINTSSGAFYGNNIEKLVIPANLVEIGSDTFANNPLTRGIIFEDGRDIIIKSHAFWDTDITEVTFPERVKEIHVGAFEAASSLKTFSFEGSKVKGIANFLFRGAGLEGRVEVPQGITTIGGRAFSSTKITELYIPETVTSLGDLFAAYSPNLEKIELPIHLKEQIEKNPKIMEGISLGVLNYYD